MFYSLLVSDWRELTDHDAEVTPCVGCSTEADLGSNAIESLELTVSAITWTHCFSKNSAFGSQSN